MTYKEKLKELQDILARKSQEFSKADNTISEINGFSDINEMTKYKKAYFDLKTAIDNYAEFESFCRNYVINMESEFPV